MGHRLTAHRAETGPDQPIATSMGPPPPPVMGPPPAERQSRKRLTHHSPRRGLPTLNVLWGTHEAVLTGDVLLAQAYLVTSGLGKRARTRMSDTILALCEGQIAESCYRYKTDRPVDEYLKSVQGKTASLLSFSAWVGASCAGATADRADLLGAYGRDLGITFQLTDDLLDIYSTVGEAGKVPGRDIAEGVYTLPVLVALDREPSLAELLTQPHGEEQMAQLRRALNETGAAAAAIEMAYSFGEDARNHLAAAEPEGGAGSDMLAALVEKVLAPLSTLNTRRIADTSEQLSVRPLRDVS